MGAQVPTSNKALSVQAFERRPKPTCTVCPKKIETHTTLNILYSCKSIAM